MTGETQFYQLFSEMCRHIQPSDFLSDSNHELPYVFIGDKASSLREDFLIPFIQKDLDHPKKIFNYGLSRACTMIEKVFDSMASAFRIFQSPINLGIHRSCGHGMLHSEQLHPQKLWRSASVTHA